MNVAIALLPDTESSSIVHVNPRLASGEAVGEIEIEGRLKRLVQLIPNDNVDAMTVMISPSMASRYVREIFLNKFLADAVSIPSAKLTLKPELEMANCMKPALRIWLRRIAVPTPEYELSIPSTISDDMRDNALRQYFGHGSNKFVEKDDVLTVQLPLERPWQDRLGGLRYFEVTALQPKEDEPCFRVLDPKLVAIAFEEPARNQGFLPISVDIDERSIPKPLIPQWKDLAEIVAPLCIPGRVMSLRTGILVHGSAGKLTVIKEAAKVLGMKTVVLECVDFGYKSLGEVYQLLTAFGQEVVGFRPCFLILRHVQYLSTWMEQMSRDANPNFDAVISTALHNLTLLSTTDADKPVVFIGTCENPRSLESSLRHVFTHELQIPYLEDTQKLGFLIHSLDKFGLWQALDNREQCVQLMEEQLINCSIRDVFALCHQVVHIFQKRDKIETGDIEQALSQYQQGLRPQPQLAEVPRVEWNDIGGLEEVKALIKETVELPIKNRSLFASGMQKRLGVLLYGPPGVGKTLLAKAIATECKTRFMSIKGPELLNMYVGETERLIRDLFDRAKKASPCVLFFDELDAFVPARGGQDAGSVMDRVVSQFLAELDAVSVGQHDVFVFGATNRKDLIDPSLLRPGRLDKLIEVGLPQKETDKYHILQSLTRKFILSTNVDLTRIARKVDADASGADLYAVCSDAWMEACKRSINLQRIDSETEIQVVVEQKDFEQAILKLGNVC